MNITVPFAGGASSTLGTCDIFSSGAGFLGTSGTSQIQTIIILTNYNYRCFKTSSKAQLSTKLTQKIHN